MGKETKTKPARARYKAISLMDTKAFTQWLMESSPGEHIVYHRGFLMVDRQAGYLYNDAPAKTINAINEVGKLALGCHEAQHVTLLQKRHGENDYEYRAYRRVAGPKAMAINDLIKQ